MRIPVSKITSSTVRIRPQPACLVGVDQAKHIRIRVAAIALVAVGLGMLPLNPIQARERSRSRPDDFGIAQVKLINDHLRQVWSENGLKPSEPATDGQWCRRVYVDLLGRIPTVEELRRYTASREPDKRKRLVDELLFGEAHADEYARHWATVWTNLLIGRSGGTDRNSLIHREGLWVYLRDAFRANRPYDQMVHELVTAAGSTTPGTSGFNGATNFLIARVNEDNATQAAAVTSRVFLGTQVQCTQCHNHPFNDWKQRKFWELNSFFRQTRALRRFVPGTRDIAWAELIDQDFAGEGSTPEEAEVYYELRNGELEVAYPVFLDGTAIPRSGYLSEMNRRAELGRLIVQSDLLERTLVNRLWAQFFGYGFTRPIDDLGPHNPPWHPDLFDALSEEFRRHSFNLKETIRWLTLSHPYALSSQSTPSNASVDDPWAGESPRFSRFYLRQMEPEALYESLRVATDQDSLIVDDASREAERSQWLRQFTIAFDTDEGGESTTFNGTIPQTLMMFNGDFIRTAVSLEPGSRLRAVADSAWKPVDKVHYLFEAGLARKATRDELALAQQMLVVGQAGVADVLQDLWWAILNSNEFILIH
jgi:hypothetical protein